MCYQQIQTSFPVSALLLGGFLLDWPHESCWLVCKGRVKRQGLKLFDELRAAGQARKRTSVEDTLVFRLRVKLLVRAWEYSLSRWLHRCSGPFHSVYRQRYTGSFLKFQRSQEKSLPALWLCWELSKGQATGLPAHRRCPVDRAYSARAPGHQVWESGGPTPKGPEALPASPRRPPERLSPR